MVSQGSHSIAGAVGSEVEDFYLSRYGRGGEPQRAGEGAAAADTRRTLELEQNRASLHGVILRPGRGEAAPVLPSAGPKDLAGEMRGPGAAAARVPACTAPHPPTST